MKRYLSMAATVWVTLILCCSGNVVADSGELNSAEAEALEFLLLYSELQQTVYERGSEQWASEAFAIFAADEQNYFEMLEEIVAHYAIEISDVGWGCNMVLMETPELDFICGVYHDPSWWDEWETYVSGTAYLEELGIRELRQAIAGTDEQLLVDAYSEMLDTACIHLLSFAEMLYHHPLDYVAQLLDQNKVDSALLEALALLSEGFEINAGLNDGWYDPDTNGQGFFVTVFPECGTIILAWLTYDTDLPAVGASANLGDPGQRWLTAQGEYDGAQAELVVFSSSGGLFDKSTPVPVNDPIGTILIEFEDCRTGSVSYDLPSAGLSGVIPIQRLASDNVMACEAQAYQAR